MGVHAEPMEVVERVLQILQHGSTASTYKYAVLLALIDVCVERADAHGMPPTSVTTLQLAERVVELYWGQTRTWPDPKRSLLAQNTQRGRSIVLMVDELRAELEGRAGRSVRPSQARLLDRSGWERLVREVEWRLIEMPLPKLQRLGGELHEWLYVLAWNDTTQRPKRGEITAYQRGQASTFDNQVRLIDGVAEALTQMHALLRPFVQQQWARTVASLNDLPESQLQTFLFGSQRIALEPVRQPLTELQEGKCFYCNRPLDAETHVDHFLPWARFGEDGLANLVAADHGCNGDKSDYLPAHTLLEKWCHRNRGNRSRMAAIATKLAWPFGEDRSFGIARAAYQRLPGGSLLWSGRKRLVPFEREAVLRALA
jgi:hypothetical protein